MTYTIEGHQFAQYEVHLTCYRSTARGTTRLYQSTHASWTEAEEAEALTLSLLPHVRTTLTDIYGSCCENRNYSPAHGNH